MGSVLSIDPEEARDLLRSWSDDVIQYSELVASGKQNIDLLQEAAPGNNTVRSIGFGFGSMQQSFGAVTELIGTVGKEDGSTVCGVCEKALNEYVEQLDNQSDVNELLD